MSSPGMINFNHAVAVWFCGFEENGANAMGAVVMHEEGPELLWRVRHADGDKHWWRVECAHRAPEDVIARGRVAFHMAAMLAGVDGEPCELLRGAMSDDEWCLLLFAQPWAQVVGLSKAEHA